MFMLVLIAIELMSSIYTYLANKAIHVEVMFIIALTAVTRKVVILDSKNVDPLYLFGLALLILALSTGYYFVKRSSSEANVEIK